MAGRFLILVGMNSYCFRFIALCCIFSLLMKCSSHVESPSFNGERAFQYLVRQVEFGPRVPGSDASAKCRDCFYTLFDSLGLEVDSQLFHYLDPYSGDSIRMVNVVARLNSDDKSSQRLLFMAHYDSRPRTDYASNPALRDKPIDGANDGASGVAVLMELANLFAILKPSVSVDLVFVDGEDWGKSGDNQNYMLGSKEFARRDIRNRYRFAVVIDMIGDKDQQLYREGYSERFHKPLNDMIWNAAERLKITSYIDSVKHAVLDDHLSLQSAGVPAVDIIDFDYAYWHTEFDVPDKCSPEALTNVGRVIAEIIYNPSLWPEK